MSRTPSPIPANFLGSLHLKAQPIHLIPTLST